MIFKVIAVMLVTVLLHGSLVAQTEPPPPVQTRAKMQQVLRKAQDKNKAVKVTLEKKIDNQSNFTGKVSEISDTGFTLTDQKTGKATKFAYEDVQQVKQKGWSKGGKIALGVVVVVVGGLTIFAATHSD